MNAHRLTSWEVLPDGALVVVTPTVRITFEPTDVQAHLIANAHDLLTALQELVRSALEAADGQPGIAELSNALEVMAKATGESS